MKSTVQKNTDFIRQKAFDYGFSFVGFSKAQKLEQDARHLEDWLNQNHHGNMTFMEQYFDKRVDPTKLVAGSKSVITFLYNYYTPEKQKDEEAPKLSMYAYGRDYHKVVKKKLVKIYKEIESEIGQIHGRCFVDSAPIMERAWARESGLGWIGKHSLMLNKEQGSYFFIGTMILDLDLVYDTPVQDHCGSCTKCIDACPTDAIIGDKLVDGSKCISYLNIELKDSIPIQYKDKMEGWMFGCDICQEVCPWNRFSKPHEEPDFVPHPDLLEMTNKDWEELTEESFDKVFWNTPVKRAQFKGLKRNIKFLKS